MSKGLEELSYIKENHLQLAKEKYRKLEPKMLEELLSRKAKRYDIIEKELKALEIIKVKRVDLFLLLDSFCETLEDYNQADMVSYKLTKEEYHLLKEVLL